MARFTGEGVLRGIKDGKRFTIYHGDVIPDGSVSKEQMANLKKKDWLDGEVDAEKSKRGRPKGSVAKPEKKGEGKGK